MRISDELLEKYGIYYNSEFVKKELPWIRKVPFRVFVTRELEKIADEMKKALDGRQAA